MFLDYVDAAPDDAVAVVDDKQRVAYGQLRRRAGQIGAVLNARYGSGRYIVLEATPDAHFVTTTLGIMYGGSTPIPVAPDLPKRDVEFIRNKSNAAAVLRPLEPTQYVDVAPVDHRDGSRPAIVLFTSGTTGYPKGVVISNENLLHSCRVISDYLGYHEHRSAAVVLPLHYSYALLSQVFCQLLVGGLVRLFTNLRNPVKFSRAVTELGIETFCGVPSTYSALTEFSRLSKIHMPSIRVLCSAGAAMNGTRLSEIKKIFPSATFFNNYGMTEAAPRISFVREDDPRFSEPTCGRPMEGVEVKIVDPKTHEQVPDGEYGMLVVRGPNVTSGYLNDQQITAKAFTSDGFLISNDIACMRESYIYIRGRHDDIFNVAGEKVAPLEIERVLNEAPGVSMSAVTRMPDPQRGNVPIAFLKLDRPLTRKEILGHLDGKVPKIKVPQRFLEVGSFPTTHNGKLQRKKLSPDDPTHVIREIN